MSRQSHALRVVPAFVASLLICGCSSSDKTLPAPASQPSQSTRPAPSPAPAPDSIAAESLEWSLEEALANLGDEELGLSAAVRLVRLANLQSSIVPSPLSPQLARRLKLVALSDSLHALGQPDEHSPRALKHPIFIDAAGKAYLPGTEPPAPRDIRGSPDQNDKSDRSIPAGKQSAGPDDNATPIAPDDFAADVDSDDLRLQVSRDGEVFPHLLIWPRRIAIAGKPGTFIALKSAERVRFVLGDERGYDYLALVVTDAPPASDSTGKPAAPVEVARYRWDPFETTFFGPAADKLPDPPGGRFEVDMEKSPLLQPMGGEIPSPDPVKTPQDVPREPM